MKIISLSLNPTFTASSGTRYGLGLILSAFAPIEIASSPKVLSKTTSDSVVFIEVTLYSESFIVIKVSPTAIVLLLEISDNTSVKVKEFNLYLNRFIVTVVPLVRVWFTVSSIMFKTSKDPR